MDKKTENAWSMSFIRERMYYLEEAMKRDDKESMAWNISDIKTLLSKIEKNLELY